MSLAALAGQPEPAVLDPFPPAVAIPKHNLGWKMFRNTAAQVAGRNLIMLGRLVVAGVIVRGCGRGVFGEYSLLFAILNIAEWVLDFGTTDVFVRDVCREPERGPRLLRILTAAKLVQIPAAFAILAAILFALRYPPAIVKAGLVGGLGLAFFAGVLLFRVIFKASLTMEHEIAGELVSVLVMIPLILLVARSGGGLVALLACHVVSRAVFFTVCLLLGGSRYRPSVRHIALHDVTWSLRSSAAIGTIGLLAVVYETLDLLLLSKLASLSDLAYYSAAQKFVLPMLVALASIGTTLYPVAASYWPQARRQFEEACQRGLDTVFLVAGVGICSMLAGPEFFMGLLGPTLVAGAPVLRVLALLCFIKCISSAIGPVLYVVHAQAQALQFIVVAVLVKAATIAVLAPRFGCVGVAFGALAVEIGCSGIPLIYLMRRRAGYRVQWTVPAKAVLITLVTAAACRLLLSGHGLMAAVLAPALYIPLLFLTGTVRLSDLRWLLKWNTA